MAPTRQRFEKLSMQLIHKLTGFESKDENYAICMDYVLSTFHYHKFLDVNSNQLKSTIQGLCDKFTIHSQKEKASAFLSLTLKFLESEVFKTHPQLDVQYSILALLVFLTKGPITELNYQAPSMQQLQAENDQKKTDWSKILYEKDEIEQLSSDEFSEWTDSEEEGDRRIVSRSTLQNQQIIQQKSVDNKATLDKGKIPNEDVCQELGRAWLKENIMPRYWAGACVIKEPRKEHPCNQLNRQWETYLEESGVMLGKSSDIVLTEYQIIREVLWLLHGTSCSFLFSNGFDKQLQEHVSLSHLTNKSLESMLSEIGRYGGIILKLEKFVDATCSIEESKDRCQTLEAYATALSHFLTNIKNKFFEIEKQVIAQNSIYTLAHVITDLRSHFEELEFLNEMHIEGIETSCSYSWQRATKLINVLYEKLMVVESFGCGYNHVIDLVLNLFLTTLKPFINMMDVWIREGVLQDRHDEFILQRHDDIDEDDEEFWNGAITIREDFSRNQNPLLPDQVRHQLLEAGKSMQLLNRLGKIEVALSDNQESNGTFYDEFLHQLELELRVTQTKETAADTSFSSLPKSYDDDTDVRSDQMMEQLRMIGDYNPLLMMNFRRMRHTSRVDIPTDSSHNSVLDGFKAPFRCPLNQGIQNALSHLMYKKYVHNCTALITVLKRDFCLLNYLSIMRKFFLMEAGDIMFNFYSQVFDMILNGQRWQDEVLLTITLQDAIAAHYPHHSSSMCVIIEETPSRLQQSIELISCIRLNCKIPWPVNIVITNRMQRMYNHIFSFLLQLKWAKYSLDELRFQNLENSRCSFMHSLPESELVKRNLAARIYLLRMRLLHFVNSIHTYIMTQSLHTTGVELEQRLNFASDLEQVVTSHSMYVDQLYHSCLLDDQMVLIRQAIVWVLNLSVNFRSKWDLGISNCTEKDISDMEGEFSKCCKFLKSFHGKSTRSGSFVEWLYNFVLRDWL